MTEARAARCWSCRHYLRTVLGPHEWRHECGRSVVGFPLLGPACRRYEYEPGADAQELNA